MNSHVTKELKDRMKHNQYLKTHTSILEYLKAFVEMKMFVISKIFYVNVISGDKHNQEFKFSPMHEHSDFIDI